MRFSTQGCCNLPALDLIGDDHDTTILDLCQDLLSGEVESELDPVAEVFEILTTALDSGLCRTCRRSARSLLSRAGSLDLVAC